MARLKIKWTVEEAPSGPYRSFHTRGWPSACYKNDRQDSCGDIHCDDDYSPFKVKSGQHAPLTVRVADYSVKPWQWRTLKVRRATLAEAKAALEDFLEKNPHFSPKEAEASIKLSPSCEIPICLAQGNKP